MKKIGLFVMMLALCAAVLVVSPQTGKTNPLVDDTGCLQCHCITFGDPACLHDIHGGFNCTICHSTIGDTPSSSTCIMCHPAGNEGECPLVNQHDPAVMGADCLTCHTNCALADGLDYGDAPEGAPAYPAMGVIGMFPTCITVGPLTWIQHTNFGAFFGPMVDFEPDGNGGLCPLFAPYDADECFMDGDAGLLVPPSFTIVGGTVVPCPTAPIGSLGITCQTAVWGGNVDIDVTNIMPNQTVGYANVLMDWDQNGMWGGSSPCPPTGIPAPEHVLINHPVPNPFSGPLSVLGPPPFLIGPNPGYVWTRFTITEAPVPLGWDGSGNYEDGESEDYLLRIDPDDVPTIFPEVPTECPVIETECPAVETFCPTVVTRCPVVDTACPVIETECPIIQTECPVIQTECPIVPTECPAGPTFCPVVETECPEAETHCPVINTQCPIAETQCPPQGPTICPEVATECPEIFTECPVEPTFCPEYFTICPEDPTFCPIFFTECPMDPTFCPQGPTLCEFTICDVIPTWCPDDPTNCPVDPTFCPTVPTVCPIDPVFTICPEVPTECPETETVCQIIDPTVCPIDATYCPVVDTECPISPTNCPAGPTLCVTVDSDGDGIDDCNDNCPNHPNGPSGGTCTSGNVGDPCLSNSDCGTGGFCSLAQEDTYPPGGNGCGDACECEGNFDDDTDQDGSDAAAFKVDFGRSTFSNPCTNSLPCNGDFDCDGDVDGTDAAKFKEDFGRSPFSNPCPICPTDPWCVYP